MASEWTAQEYEVAMDQRDELFPGFGECSGDPETEETAEKMLDLLCQRNRLLAFARRVAHQYAGTDAPSGQEANAAIATCQKGDAR